MNGRILVLSGDAFHASGGIAQFNRDLIGAWSSMASVEQIVILPRFSSGPSGELPPKVVEDRAANSLHLYISRAILTILRRPSFSCVFCGHLNMVPLAVVLSRLSGAPIWLQLHGIEAWSKPSEIVRWSVEKATLITCVSRYTRRKFLGWAHVPPQQVLVLPNTVGEQFTPVGPEKSVAGRYGLSGRKIMLSVSRLSKREGYKGHDRVIRCMPKLLEEYDDLLYVIAGEGDLESELRALAGTLGVDHAVSFLGPVEHADLPSLYREADVFAMPSTGEGFGIVFLEALACGTPVIAGAHDGARDPLQDGALGVLSDDEGLMASIRAVLAGEGLMPNLKQVQALRAESMRRHFGWSVFSTQAMAITDRVLARINA